MIKNTEEILYDTQKQLLTEHKRQLKSFVRVVNSEIKKVDQNLTHLEEEFFNKNQLKIDF